MENPWFIKLVGKMVKLDGYSNNTHQKKINFV